MRIFSGVVMKVSTILASGVLMASALCCAGFAAAQGPATAAAPTASSKEAPSEIVQSTAQSILKDLDANRDAYRKDPAKVGQLVDKYLLPHFDTEYAAKLVLGQYWRSATPDQRK